MNERDYSLSLRENDIQNDDENKKKKKKEKSEYKFNPFTDKRSLNRYLKNSL